MLTFKNPHNARPRPQKGKLSQLLDCFEANPHSSYQITVYQGELLTTIDGDSSFLTGLEDSEDVEQPMNCEEVQPSPMKKVGLFGNIIRNMEAKKHHQECPHPPKQPQKPRAYTFYFSELDHKNKKIEQQRNRPNTAEAEQNYFDHIEIIDREEDHQDSNKENQSNTRKNEQFVDLNFSFDEISKQIQSLKKDKKAERTEQRQNDQDTIIRKYLNENSEAEAEGSKNQIKFSKGSKAEKQSIAGNERNKIQSINFAKLSKECKIAEAEPLPPLPLKSKSSFSKGLLKQPSALEGTKKVQSRIVAGNPTDPLQIDIDFDLDINFI